MQATLKLDTTEIAKIINEAIKPLQEELKQIKIKLETEEEERLTIKDVRKMTKLGTTSIYNKMKEGTFPKSYKEGSRTYWLKSDILEWINAR